MGKRAITDAAKQQKAAAILDCAADLFLASGYNAVTMAAVAKRMHISNGILFVYFPTKQTLFLSLLMREYHARIDAMERLLASNPPHTLAALCALILQDLAQQLHNTLYIRLEAIRAAILEQNVDMRWFLNLKITLYKRLQSVAALAAIPGVITADEVQDIFHVQTALIEGFQLAGKLNEPLRKALTGNGLHAFVYDFHADTLRTMRLYLNALQAEKAKA